ncbi:MAG TPA: hypothetical protein VJ894_02095 [Cryomorphaceae bacterium]|nr:hypothetical protein [Cryomorphaceae bacterium]
MSILPLKPLPETSPSKGLIRAYDRFSELLHSIENLDLKEESIEEINRNISSVNEVEDPKKFKIQLLKKRHNTLKILEKNEKLVAKNHYRNLWMALGMTVFGLPFGVVFAMSLDNMAFIAIGLPIGMPIGMAIGAQKDKQAAEEGRQLDIES